MTMASDSEQDPTEEMDRDEILAMLLSELSDRAARGEEVDILSVAKSHPDLADELKQLWGAVMIADAVGSDVKDATVGAGPGPDITSALELPCRIGDYELQEELGRGGMGVVYKALHVSLNRIVALKMLLRGRFASADDQARFRAEAEAIAQLDHPNIVPVYEVGQLEGHVYFSMKYVQGRTLSQVLADGPIDPNEAARILSLIAKAVDFAHRRGVLHRDLKPSNILIDDEGQPHVNDFGLAKQLSSRESITRSGAVLGTPAYMSPEQAAGNRSQVGPASDIYSLGAILYHSITGKPPFTGSSAVDVVLRVREEDAPMARTVNPSANRDLEMIATRCLQKPVDLRYQSAADLGKDLDAWLADEPVAARTGRMSQIAALMFRETHHVAVLENWGLLWMWHSLVLLVVCVLTNVLQQYGVSSRWAFGLLWTAGLGAWALVFWMMRQRMGPVTFVERQIAHIWAGSMMSIASLFPLEAMFDFPVLKLSPLLGVSSGVVFLVKAAMLSGGFYFQAVALFLCTFAMAYWPQYGHTIFGVTAGLCFFLPGWKYHQRKLANMR